MIKSRQIEDRGIICGTAIGIGIIVVEASIVRASVIQASGNHRQFHRTQMAIGKVPGVRRTGETQSGKAKRQQHHLSRNRSLKRKRDAADRGRLFAASRLCRDAGPALSNLVKSGGRHIGRIPYFLRAWVFSAAANPARIYSREFYSRCFCCLR